MSDSLLLGSALAVANLALFTVLLEKVNNLMATVTTINDKLDALSKDADRLTALFASEEAEGESAGVASQAEIDGIDTKVAAIQAKLAAIQDEEPGVPVIN